MKTRAMVGFTRCDALVWIADEARVMGHAMMVSADGKTVTLKDDRYVILRPGDSISGLDQIVFDEIIEREIAA